MILYIFRHGETIWNKLKKIQGQVDVPLNEDGIREAKETGEALKHVKFDYAFTSPLDRAMDTAQMILGDRNLDIILDDRIMEIAYGEVEGKIPFVDELPQNFYTTFKTMKDFVTPKGAESIQQVKDRTTDFLHMLYADEKYQDAVIFISAHGTSGRAMMQNFWGEEDFWHGDVPPNCSCCIVELSHDHQVVSIQKDVVYHSLGGDTFFDR